MTDHALLTKLDRGDATKETLASARRLIIKIGSDVLADPSTGEVRTKWLEELIGEIKAFKTRGQQVLIVTSGAITFGRTRLGRLDGEMKLVETQAAAAVGQMHLAQLYESMIADHGMAAAQILLIREDAQSRCGHMNARAALNWLLDLGVIPVINENDAVSTEEICFGDNDRLAAYVAQIVTADTLLLLSDVERPDDAAAVCAGTPGASSNRKTGARLEDVRIATDAGCRVAIAPGGAAIGDGVHAIWFLPEGTPLGWRKRWIADSAVPSGAVVVDEIAAARLRHGAAVLPGALIAVEGCFDRGDTILIRGPDGREIGRGLAAYSCHEAARICGRHNDEIAEYLGYRGPAAIIDSDDLVFTASNAL